MNINSDVLFRQDNFLRITPLEIKYYNIVFTDDEVILDYRNSSFKPWIIRVNAYKDIPYEGLSVDDIKNRSESNVVISYRDFEEVKLLKRTFFKNACIEIKQKHNENVLRLITKEKINFDSWNNILNKLKNEGCKLVV